MTTIKIPIKHKRLGINFMEIDEEDFDKIENLSSIILNTTSNKTTYYAKSVVYENKKYVKKINIHRLIMGLGDYKNDKRIINHIDGNGLNNKKENLEICDIMYNSQSHNQKNRVRKNYYFENDPKRKKKWKATKKLFGKRIDKRFLTEQECIDYIDEVEKKYIT